MSKKKTTKKKVIKVKSKVYPYANGYLKWIGNSMIPGVDEYGFYPNPPIRKPSVKKRISRKSGTAKYSAGYLKWYKKVHGHYPRPRK